MMLDACLMVHGSWLKAHGSWPREARGGSWLMAKGRPDPGDPGAGGAGPGPGALPHIVGNVARICGFGLVPTWL